MDVDLVWTFRQPGENTPHDTVKNPASPFGARGVITIPTSNPFPIGMIKRKDLFSGCLLPTCFSRDRRPCVQSITWSFKMAPNGRVLVSCLHSRRMCKVLSSSVL